MPGKTTRGTAARTEVGNRQAHEAHERGQVVAHRVLMGGREHAYRDGDQVDEHQRDRGQEQGPGKPLDDQSPDRLGPHERHPEVALHQVAQPFEILHEYRLIDAVALPHCDDFLFVEKAARFPGLGHGDRNEIAGRKLDDEEGNDGDDQQRRNRQQDPPAEKQQHQRARPAAPSRDRSRSPGGALRRAGGRRFRIGLQVRDDLIPNCMTREPMVATCFSTPQTRPFQARSRRAECLP